MATCVNCSKHWNSWGSGDAFCSGTCEEDHQNKIHTMLNNLAAISSPDAINILTSIIENVNNVEELQSYLVNLFELQGYLQKKDHV